MLFFDYFFCSFERKKVAIFFNNWSSGIQKRMLDRIKCKKKLKQFIPALCFKSHFLAIFFASCKFCLTNHASSTYLLLRFRNQHYNPRKNEKKYIFSKKKKKSSKHVQAQNQLWNQQKFVLFQEQIFFSSNFFCSFFACTNFSTRYPCLKVQWEFFL
jgi:hypothetical protein